KPVRSLTQDHSSSPSASGERKQHEREDISPDREDARGPRRRDAGEDADRRRQRLRRRLQPVALEAFEQAREHGEELMEKTTDAASSAEPDAPITRDLNTIENLTRGVARDD